MRYPILMADVINSHKKGANELILGFKQIVDQINKKWAAEILSPLTITLGDEFQGVINTMGNAYQIIFAIEEEIVKRGQDLKLRYVLNEGEIDTPINRKIAYEMLGEGLTEARKQLNDLKGSKNRFLIRPKDCLKTETMINDLFKLYASYIDSWKLNEFYIVTEFLLHKPYQQVAGELGVNVSSSWRRWKSLHIEEYFICKKLVTDLNSMLNA